MVYFITIGLTLLALCSIIIIRNTLEKKLYTKTIYRQSDMHNMLKAFFLLDIEDKNSVSQIKKRKKEKTTSVVILKDKAYWVKDNVFYIGEAKGGEAIPETGMPINTNTLSDSEISKLLFILDNLKGGKKNDSGSTGNR